MVSEENSSVKTLMQILACSLWKAEQGDDDSSSHLVDIDPPDIVKNKMISSGFEILLKQKHLWKRNQDTDGEAAVFFALYLQFNHQGYFEKDYRESPYSYIQIVENTVQKYEAAEAVFAFLAAMHNSKPNRKIKPNEMLSCFHFGALKHCVPPHLRSQTIQDQFEMLSDPHVNITSTSSSYSGHNPFTLRRSFDYKVPSILLAAPALNPNVPRALTLVEPSSSSVLNQDEGYVTPGSANILEEANTQEDKSHKVWPQTKLVYNSMPSWNTLGELSTPVELDFIFDFKPADTDDSDIHLKQVLQCGREKPNPTHTKLFTHLRNREEFTRDLRNLLLGIPSDCFSFDEDENRFTCAYGIYTQHISPEYLEGFLRPALECGNYVYMLKHLDRDRKKGHLYMSFVESVQEYLRRYDTQIISKLREDSELHYIELQEFISNLFQRLSSIAQLWKADTHLLNHIYSKALDSFVTNQNRALNIVVATIFEYCTNTYFELLEKWLFQGEHHDSLVTQSSSHSVKSRQFWSKGFRFNRAQNPVFLADYEDQIFACGKNICLLKLTNPEDPLFSIDFNLIPRLKFYLTKESLNSFHAQCKVYESAVIQACGEVPQFTKLLEPQEYSQDQLKQWQEQARERREIYIQKLQDERLKKRELQAAMRRKMLLEIESIEQKKKDEKEKELQQDMKIMEEAKRMDEEYWRLKELEKRKIEEYYKSLMEMIEKRAELATSKTKSLEAMKTLLKKRVSKEKLSTDMLDGKFLDPQSSNINVASPSREPTDTSSQTSTSSAASSKESQNSADELFSLDIPEPPNVELLMRKIEQEEEAILLTRETQKRLEDLRCNRVQARTNRNKILSSVYNICTGKATEKPAGPFDLKEKYMEGQTTDANEEAKTNRSRAQGSDMSHCMRRDIPAMSSSKEKSMEGQTTDANEEAKTNRSRAQGSDMSHCMRRDVPAISSSKEKSTNSDKTLKEVCDISANIREETEVLRRGSHTLDAHQSALFNKKKILSAEFDIQAPVGTTCDSTDGITCENKVTSMEDLPAADKKIVLSAREEALRNRSKVMSHEFHVNVTRTKVSTDNKSPARNNQIETSSVENTLPSIITEVTSSELNESKSTPKELSELPESNALSPQLESNEAKCSTEPTDQCETISQSTISSSENLVTIISNESKDSITTEPKLSLVNNKIKSNSKPSFDDIFFPKSVLKINPTWTFDSLFDENSDLDVTLVQKYLESSISVPLYIQYRLTNEAVMRLFLHKHHLATHLITLRNYFFLLDGSFAKSLTRDLSLQIQHNLLLLLNPFKLNSILRKAVSFGTCDTKMQNNLTFVVKNYETISNLQESNVFQYISLSYKVDWPLNIVLTPEALTNYDKVFVFLMQVQQVSHTLQQVFVYLKRRKHLEANHLYIYRQINLFRHVMTQVLCAVQNYIHCSVLELPWHDMVEAFKKPVTLDSVYYRHVEYVKQIIFRCLLNKRSRGLTEALNAMFKTILDFYEELERRSPEKSYEQLVAIFQKFLKITLYFHDYCKKMVTVGYQEQNLDYLLHMLSLNDYFSKAIHS